MKRRGSLVLYLKNFFHSKAVRLDVYLSDEKGTIYEIWSRYGDGYNGYHE